MQFADGVLDVEAIGVCELPLGLGSKVAVAIPAFVGGNVTVTKSGVDVSCGGISIEIHDASNALMRRNIIFLHREVIAAFIFRDGSVCKIDYFYSIVLQPLMIFKI